MTRVARLAAETGISPQALLGLEGELWLALAREADRRWTATEELLAFQCELLHELVRVNLARMGQRPPKPLHITRPQQLLELEAKPPPSTAAQILAFASAHGGGIHRG